MPAANRGDLSSMISGSPYGIRPGPETPEMARRYDMLEDGMTVGEALQRFTWRGLRGLGRRRYLRKLLEHRNISIT